MTFRRRSLTLLLTVLLTAATLLPSVGPVFAQPASALAAPAPATASADVPSIEIVKQAYDLLLDRYVQQLNPADLLNAGYAGLVKALSDAGVAVKSPGPLQLSQDRDEAWGTFKDRVTALLQQSPPPADLSLSGAAIGAMTRWIDEGHTSYLTPQQYQDFLAYLRGDVRYSGIGLRPKRPSVTVAEVFAGSPAEAAGVQLGDLITAVNGEPTDGKTLEQVAQLIRGPEGTAVVLEIDRPSTGEHLRLSIVRASIRVDFVSTDVIQDSVAYIRLRGFPEPSVADHFEQFLDSLPDLHVRGLVIDLRGNTGGRIDVGVRLLNRFISSGPLFQQGNRGGQHRVQSATGSPGHPLPVLGRDGSGMYVAVRPSGAPDERPLPIAILIDDGTASMGEIFASAMHEHGLATLIGKTTSGNVAAAQVFPLGDGSGLQITIQEIYSGDGELLNRVGVAPDVQLDTSPAEADQGRDVPLEAAVQYVWQRSDQYAAVGTR